MHAIQCQDQKCDDLYIGETKQTVAKCMYQHGRASTAGSGESAVHTICVTLVAQNKDAVILDKEARWFERNVKKAIYV